jgi:hypothetical protein
MLIRDINSCPKKEQILTQQDFTRSAISVEKSTFLKKENTWWCLNSQLNGNVTANPLLRPRFKLTQDATPEKLIILKRGN